MMTKWMFVAIVLAVVVQRVLEVRLSKRNAAKILEKGGREESDNALPLVKLLQICWWISMIAEVWWFDRPFIPALAVVGILGAITGQVLRYLSMQALGWRWTLPIMTVPDQPLVQDGIYAYLRHPNWLGVVIEIAALPLIHNAYLTALFFSLVNGVLMYKRIQLEEAVLQSSVEPAAS